FPSIQILVIGREGEATCVHNGRTVLPLFDRSEANLAILICEADVMCAQVKPRRSTKRQCPDPNSLIIRHVFDIDNSRHAPLIGSIGCESRPAKHHMPTDCAM